MERKKKVCAVVYSQRRIADDIYDMWIETDLAKNALPGQFISIYPQDKSIILPRPISICETDKEKELLRVVYRIAGKGTREFSKYREKDEISVLGVLGNGFPIAKAKGKAVLLMGGGIGIPPMLEVAKELAEANKSLPDQDRVVVKSILGYRSELFLAEELEKYSEIYIATEDGSEGSKGNVMNVIADHDLKGELIFACGPMPMLRAVKQFAAEHQIEAYLSLEERMACGVGACLGCVCKTTEKDHHSHVNNARVCTDGPVYNAKEVDI